MLRKSLVYLRRQYNTNLMPFGRMALLGVIALTITSLLVDTYIPFGQWWNVIRTALMIPIAAGIFSLGYLLSLYLHYKKMEEGNWIPYRLRFSVMWRRRIAMIIGAIMFVFIYATNNSDNGERIGYTLTSSFFVAIVIAAFAFLRVTKEENIREELDIPDSRDISYNADKREREVERRRKETEKAAKKKIFLKKNITKQDDETDAD